MGIFWVPPFIYLGDFMPTPRRTFDAATLQPLLEYLRTQCPDRRLTLTEAEDAIMALFRVLGPALLETVLESAALPTAEKKGHRRSVRADRRCVGSPSGNGR